MFDAVLLASPRRVGPFVPVHSSLGGFLGSVFISDRFTAIGLVESLRATSKAGVELRLHRRSLDQLHIPLSK
ncbi:hypothetical protein EYF80_059990 [Liparis tanakae]|uniref:Uncharacterized protein n=1 Tax=Liparis tanakae TaxID=230148 RepID=A0A4Z2EMR0_9TELE|nr:hypothetical protein EYF80_059990 [Liparis tanakae]